MIAITASGVRKSVRGHNTWPLKWTHGWPSRLITDDKQWKRTLRSSGISAFCHLITFPSQKETCLLLCSSFCFRRSGSALAVVLKCSNQSKPVCCACEILPLKVLSILYSATTQCLKATRAEVGHWCWSMKQVVLGNRNVTHRRVLPGVVVYDCIRGKFV